MKTIKVAIAGLGNVGKGTYEILKKDANRLNATTSTNFEVTAVCARSKKDFIDSNITFYENALDLANDNNVDVVIEVIGGCTIAKELVEKSLQNGKKVITANKALMAEHGFELAKLAESLNTSIKFESAVAGSLPIIKNFKEGLIANEIEEFYGILNGTCNFILSKMANEGLDFAPVLKEAQKLGFAEADPTFDVKGIDAAHKLALLAAIASATKPAFKDMYVEGVDKISSRDIKLARELGYEIKLLGIYKKLENSTQQSVYPSLVKQGSKISQINLSFNTILAKTSNAGINMSIGLGAGSLPTASAVVADLCDIATSRDSKIFNVSCDNLGESKVEKISNRVGKYFINLEIDKEKIQKEDLSQKLFTNKIAIEKCYYENNDNLINGGFITSPIKETNLEDILNNLDTSLVKSSKFLRVEEIDF
ncbi:MAG: homoserine dehydrogenase [Rickettsiales bacterium]|nr:homoserine dehydrogenase [Rickettsiales bacterium]